MSRLVLVVGNKNYSSWSLRAWIMLKQIGLEFDEIVIPLEQTETDSRILQYSPSGKVPVLIDGGIKVWESLAIGEYLAEKLPDARLWPTEKDARAYARAISCEMHAGFTNLRSNMTMNIRKQLPEKGRGPGVQEDIDRICAIWKECREKYSRRGEFLFGHFTIADAMFAPVVTRFTTYEVPVEKTIKTYMESVLALPAMKDWTAAAKQEKEMIPAMER